MRNFTYHVPTEVIFGGGAENHTAEAIRRYGGSRVLLLYGGGSAVRSGLLDRIVGQLRDAGLVCEAMGGVRPNPRVAFAREAIARAIAMEADFILGLGGGSVIDTAKAVAHGTANPQLDVWNDIWLHPENLKKSLPVGAIPTIPAAGSETSDSSVLTDEDSDMKRGLSTQLNRPAFAILDPALAATLPPYQVGCGVTDIMMHTLDRYFNPATDNELTDAIAEALLRVVIRNGRAAAADPADLHAMSEIYWAGSLSHNGLTGLGGQKDFAPHQLSQALGGLYDKAHGACLASIWGSWARYVLPTNPDRFVRYARNVWGIEGPDAAEAGIRANEDYFRSLGMPVGLPGLLGGPVDEEALDRLARQCSYGGTRTIGTFRALNEADMRAIFADANRRA